jgi:hypothetical protein
MRRLIAVASVLACALAVCVAKAEDPAYKVALWSVASIDADPADCADQVQAVRDALAVFDVPASRPFKVTVSREFSWVVVCNERAWFHLRNEPRYARVNTNSAMTDFPNHVVFLDGFRHSPAALRDSVAHEMGHMLCQCADEGEADRWKLILVEEADRQSRQRRAQVSAAQQ